jgi:hypothetical protein
MPPWPVPLLRKGGGLVDAPGRGLVGVKGNSPYDGPLRVFTHSDKKVEAPSFPRRAS